MRDGHAGGVAELRRFSSDGVDIAFIDVEPQGRDLGEPILLIHGFASNHRINWVNPRWVETLTRGRAPRRGVRQPRPRAKRKALRARRLSRRSHDPGRGQPACAFGRRARRRDGLFDGRADRELPRAWPTEPRALARARAASATGWCATAACRRRSPKPWRRRRSTASPTRRSACSAPSPSRRRATAPRSPPASAACAGSLTLEEAARINQPTLVAVGERDTLAGDPSKLVALLPRAEALLIPGRDHNLAVGDKAFKAGAA